jgi:hypothetical protein
LSSAAKLLLGRLCRRKIRVRVLTTDLSSSLKKLLRDVNAELSRRKLPPIKHMYDVWHMVKVVIKDCIIATKLNKCQTLGSWIKSLRNMLWYCFSACKGDPLLLCEMILSIPKHINWVHEFQENKLFNRCLHGELGDDRSKPWLKPGSLIMKKLNEAIRGKKDCRLKDLAMMTEFQHTSINKNINAKHNTYFSRPLCGPASLSLTTTTTRIRSRVRIETGTTRS